MEFLMDFSVLIGLMTLVALEIILGIDNLFFIIILTNSLVAKQRNKARFIGLFLALIMRLSLLFIISWITTLTRPLFSIADFTFSGRDLIMLLGGIFLLFKATFELHDRLENNQNERRNDKNYTNFWVVIIQIVMLDAVFSLDSVITAVGMVNHLLIMMIAVIIAASVMLLALKPLTRFVNQHPTVIVLCLSFLLMIGFSLEAEGLGFHIPKGYLYAAIGFSILIELFNQIAYRNLIKQQSNLQTHNRTIGVISCLRNKHCQNNIQSDFRKKILISNLKFVEEEYRIINNILSLLSRSLRVIMTPRSEISWIDINLSTSEIREKLLSSPYSLFPICRGKLDEFIGVMCAKEILLALEENRNIESLVSMSSTILVLETLNIISLISIFCQKQIRLAIVVNEFRIIQGLVAPFDFLRGISEEISDVSEI